MSNSHAEDTVHTGPIKNPKQLLLTVAAAFIIPIFLIIGLVLYVATAYKPAGTNQAASMQLGGVSEHARERAQALRLQKVGMVEIRDANRPVRTGEEVFKAQCSACHTAGVAGAPKFGDKSAWAPRIAHGYDALLNSALHGKGAMAPQGGGDFSDFEIGRAVVYMANAGGANFPEPKPAASQSASGGGESAQAAQTAQAAVPASPAAAAATVEQAKDNAAAATQQPAAKDGSAAANPATTLAATTPAASNAPAAPAPSAAPAAAERVAAVSPAPAPAAASGAGEALYKSACFACHAAGVAGAPKFGDKAAWAPRIATGIDTLVAAAIKGIGAMPPRGGSTASDADMRAAVEYMVNAAK